MLPAIPAVANFMGVETASVALEYFEDIVVSFVSSQSVLFFGGSAVHGSWVSWTESLSFAQFIFIFFGYMIAWDRSQST